MNQYSPLEIGERKQEPRTDQSLRTDGLCEPLGENQHDKELLWALLSSTQFSFCRCQIRWEGKIGCKHFGFPLWLLSFSLAALSFSRGQWSITQNASHCTSTTCLLSSHHLVPFLFWHRKVARQRVSFINNNGSAVWVTIALRLRPSFFSHQFSN